MGIKLTTKYIKYVLPLSLVLTLSVISHAGAPAGKIIGKTIGEALSHAGDAFAPAFKELIQKLGLETNEMAAEQLSRSIDNAIKALNKGKPAANVDELKRLFDLHPKLRPFKELLERQIGDSSITSRKFMRMVNRLGYDAEVGAPTGKFLMCGTCIDPALRKMGMVGGINEAPTGIKNLLSSLSMPKTRKQMRFDIQALAKRQELGILNLSRSTRGVKRKWVKSLYIALRASLSGTPDQKMLGKSIKRYYTINGKTNFEGDRVWMLLTYDYGPQDMKKVVAFLDDVNSRPVPRGQKSRKGLLLMALQKLAGDDPDRNADLRKLVDLDCLGLK